MNSVNTSVVFVLIWTCLTFVCSAPSTRDVTGVSGDSNGLTRLRRSPGFYSLFQFRNMIQCAVNRSALAYSDYGCWCGYGGSGKPVDQVDACCHAHDKCYDAIMVSGICGYSWQVYFTTYKYSNCTSCDPASSYPADDLYIPCRLALCACDRVIVQCFQRSPYSCTNYQYDTKKCI